MFYLKMWTNMLENKSKPNKKQKKTEKDEK